MGQEHATSGRFPHIRYDEDARNASLPPTIEDWHSSAGPNDLLSSVRSDLQSALAKARESVRHLQDASNRLRQLEEDNQSGRIAVEDEARRLRKELDDLKKGAGVVARRVSDLREKTNQLAALEALTKQKSQKLQETQAKRGALLDRLDELREQRFEERQRLPYQNERADSLWAC